MLADAWLFTGCWYVCTYPPICSYMLPRYVLLQMKEHSGLAWTFPKLPLKGPAFILRSSFSCLRSFLGDSANPTVPLVSAVDLQFLYHLQRGDAGSRRGPVPQVWHFTPRQSNFNPHPHRPSAFGGSRKAIAAASWRARLKT